MKRILISLLAFCALTGAAVAKKQSPAPKTYPPLPARYDGTMATLDTLAYETMAFPDTLTPISIDYVARHGARYLSSAKKTETLRHVLRVAAERNVITEHGRTFVELLDRIDAMSAGKWGLLSPTGEAEQRFLGHWLLKQFPDLVGKGRISAISSYVPRVVQTMYGLTGTILTADPQEKEVSVSTSEGREYDRLVRFFEANKSYEVYLDKGNWTPLYTSWFRENVSPAPAQRMFTPDAGIREEIMRTLTMHIYSVLQGLRSSDIGVPTTQWMTEEEYMKCWEAENLDKYLRRTWTSLSDEAARAVTPLLIHLITSLDDAAKASAAPAAGANRTPVTTANMVFGHAETLLPLFSLMNLAGCSVLPKDVNMVAAKWKDYEISPMGANMVIALLKSSTGRLYAATCLNGRWVEPLRDKRKIVPYSELRTYWITRAQAAAPRK